MWWCTSLSLVWWTWRKDYWFKTSLGYLLKKLFSKKQITTTIKNFKSKQNKNKISWFLIFPFGLWGHMHWKQFCARWMLNGFSIHRKGWTKELRPGRASLGACCCIHVCLCLQPFMRKPVLPRSVHQCLLHLESRGGRSILCPMQQWRLPQIWQGNSVQIKCYSDSLYPFSSKENIINKTRQGLLVDCQLV